MSKTILTFDIGESYIKIAYKEKEQITVYVEQMPENLMKDGIIQMPHMMTDFLKELKKEYHLPKGDCGVVIPDELTVCRKLTLPAMTEKQLEVNLPFEFSDYISGEPQKYVYDYAMQEMVYDEDGKPKEMILTGAVMSKESVLSYVNIFKNAGFKLRTLIPQEIALTNIMKQAVADGRVEKDKEYCIVNLGHRATQVYIYKGDELMVLRTIHVGNSVIDRAISEHENVDTFVARTYKNKNYNGILEKEYAREAFGTVAVEVMKVINFYRFNNRESQLEEMYFLGGGSNIKELCDSIANANELAGKSIMELLPNNVARDTDLSGTLAIGVLLQ
ncbi:MAG: pilus assembly protein PilM [Agathobacter sp.]|nr:pilus assembly protein PilM [Agathobacter sp.]